MYQRTKRKKKGTETECVNAMEERYNIKEKQGHARQTLQGESNGQEQVEGWPLSGPVVGSPRRHHPMLPSLSLCSCSSFAVTLFALSMVQGEDRTEKTG